MIAKNPLINRYSDNLSVLQRIEEENNLTEITVKRGALDYLPVLLSLTVNLFGIWAFTDLITDKNLYKALILLAVGGAILLMERNRTELLGDWFGTLLERRVNPKAKLPLFSLLAAFAITVTLISMDVMGSFSFKTYLDTTAKDGKLLSSAEYQTAKADNDMKNIAFKDWIDDKRIAFNGCDQSYPLTENPNGNAWCKRAWSKKNPKPSIGADLSIKLTTISTKTDDNVSQYFFTAFLTLSLMFAYLAVAAVFRQYRAKEKQLTGEMVEVIRDRFEKMKTAKIDKMRQSTEAMNTKIGEAYAIDVELETTDYNLGIARTLEILNSRKATVNNIMSVGYTEPQQRHGFIGGFGGGKNNPNGTVNESVITSPLIEKQFTAKEWELVKILWDNGTVKPHDALVLRDTVLGIVGNTKVNSFALAQLYKKLLDQGYITKRIGYFANAYLGD